MKYYFILILLFLIFIADSYAISPGEGDPGLPSKKPSREEVEREQNDFAHEASLWKSAGFSGEYDFFKQYYITELKLLWVDKFLSHIESHVGKEIKNISESLSAYEDAIQKLKTHREVVLKAADENAKGFALNEEALAQAQLLAKSASDSANRLRFAIENYQKIKIPMPDFKDWPDGKSLPARQEVGLLDADYLFLIANAADNAWFSEFETTKALVYTNEAIDPIKLSSFLIEKLNDSEVFFKSYDQAIRLFSESKRPSGAGYSRIVKGLNGKSKYIYNTVSTLKKYKGSATRTLRYISPTKEKSPDEGINIFDKDIQNKIIEVAKLNQSPHAYSYIAEEWTTSIRRFIAQQVEAYETLFFPTVHVSEGFRLPHVDLEMLESNVTRTEHLQKTLRSPKLQALLEAEAASRGIAERNRVKERIEKFDKLFRETFLSEDSDWRKAFEARIDQKASTLSNTITLDLKSESYRARLSIEIAEIYAHIKSGYLVAASVGVQKLKYYIVTSPFATFHENKGLTEDILKKLNRLEEHFSQLEADEEISNASRDVLGLLEDKSKQCRDGKVAPGKEAKP